MLETAVLQVTAKCPYQCPQCYMQKGEREMTPDDARTAIDYAKARGAVAVQITGGEPLCYSGLPRLIEYAASRQMFTLLATSGYRHSRELYESLRLAGLTAICVSVNGSDEEGNSATRDAYHQAMAAIADAVATGLLCFVNVVVTDDNIQSLLQIGSQMKRLGVEGINLLRPMPSHDGNYMPRLSQSTLLKMRAIVDFDQYYRVENCFLEYWSLKNGGLSACRDVGRTTFFVNADGSYSPCSKLTAIRYPTADLLFAGCDGWKKESCTGE